MTKMLAGEEASIEIVQRWLQRRGSDEIETGTYDEKFRQILPKEEEYLK